MYIHFISYFIILFNSTHACVIILQYCNHKLSQFYFILRDKWKQTVFSKSFVKYMYTKSFGNLIIVLHVLLWLKWIWNWPCLTHSHKLCSMCLLQIIVKIFVSKCFKCSVDMIAIQCMRVLDLIFCSRNFCFTGICFVWIFVLLMKKTCLNFVLWFL